MEQSLISFTELGNAPRSQTSAAYVRIRADILQGQLIPGEKLKGHDLAAKLGVSPGAIREALSRLVPEGYVVAEDQKGFVVAPLSLSDLFDLTRLRCDIEEMALRRAVADGDERWEGAVMAAAHTLRRTARLLESGCVNPAWPGRHEIFHRTLVAGCASPRLLNMHAQLYAQAERYRNVSVHFEGDRDVEAEHQSIADAALDRDVEELVRRARNHLELTTSLIAAADQISGMITT